MLIAIALDDESPLSQLLKSFLGLWAPPSSTVPTASRSTHVDSFRANPDGTGLFNISAPPLPAPPPPPACFGCLARVRACFLTQIVASCWQFLGVNPTNGRRNWISQNKLHAAPCTPCTPILPSPHRSSHHRRHHQDLRPLTRKQQRSRKSASAAKKLGSTSQVPSLCAQPLPTLKQRRLQRRIMSVFNNLTQCVAERCKSICYRPKKKRTSSA